MSKELEFDASALAGLNDGDDEAVFKNVNYVQLLLKYRYWLVLGGIAGVMLGFGMYLRSGPEYEATAQVLVSRKDTVPVREEERTLSDWGERSEHIALILSPLIINRAVEIGQLQNLKTFKGSKEIAQDIIEDLRVKRSSGQDRSYTNVLTITYPNRSKEDARAVVEAVISAYGVYLQETRTEKSSEVLALTQRALRDVEVKLRDKEAEYHEFRETAPLQWKAPVGSAASDGQTTTNVHQERVLAAEEQRRLNLLRKATLQSRQKAIEVSVEHKEPRDVMEVLIRRFIALDGAAGGEFQSQQQQDISIFENRLLPLILEEKELLRDYGPDHPDVQLKRQAIQTALDFYRRQGVRLPEERRQQKADGTEPGEIDLVSLYAESLRQEVAELDLRDQQLALLVEDESKKAKGVARFQAKDEAIHAELGRLRDLWGTLVTQVNQVGIEREGNGYVMKQIAPVKEELSMKRIMKFVGGGGIFGGFIIAALCILRELRDLRIKTVGELRKATSQPLLGTVGHFNTGVDPRVNGSQYHTALRYLRAPRSMEAESYRSLRSALNVAMENSQTRVMLVTSPEAGDGKTTTTGNLAVALAHAGKRVLLIDADLRRPTLHQLFRVPVDIGLSDVLSHEIDALNAIRQTSIERLSILPAGRASSNPAELISGPALSDMLKPLRDEYDVILVDSPPLLAVSDASVIARATDSVLLVVRLGKTSLTTARRCRDQIATHGLKMIGMVANDTAANDLQAYSSGDSYYRDYEESQPDRQPLQPAHS